MPSGPTGCDQADNVSLQLRLDSVAADAETEQADKIKVK